MSHQRGIWLEVEGYMVVSLNYCSQNGGNLYRAPYYNRNPNIGPRIIGNLDQYPHGSIGRSFEAPRLGNCESCPGAVAQAGVPR